MKNFANFVLFQVAWFGCVTSAAGGQPWRGVLIVAVAVGVHLAFVARPHERRRELGYVIAVGCLGFLLDSLLGSLGATRYPGTEGGTGFVLAPAWITSMWVLFATLPYHSLGWLRGRAKLAVVLGAVGGPLSYFAGVRAGAVEVGDNPLLTWGALAVEYALVTPLLLRLASRRAPEQS